MILKIFFFPFLNDIWSKDLSLSRVLQVLIFLGLFLINGAQWLLWFRLKPIFELFCIGLIHDPTDFLNYIEFFLLRNWPDDSSVLIGHRTYLWLIVRIQIYLVWMIFEMFGPIVCVNGFGVPSKDNVPVILNVESQLLWSQLVQLFPHPFIDSAEGSLCIFCNLLESNFQFTLLHEDQGLFLL